MSRDRYFLRRERERNVALVIYDSGACSGEPDAPLGANMLE